MKKEERLRLNPLPDPEERKKKFKLLRELTETLAEKIFDSYTVFEAPLPRTSLYCNKNRNHNNSGTKIKQNNKDLIFGEIN